MRSPRALYRQSLCAWRIRHPRTPMGDRLWGTRVFHPVYALCSGKITCPRDGEICERKCT
jgi:hypothetical protein